MNFSKRKLPPAAAATLKACPIHDLEPFALLYAPVYLYLSRNHKFVGVKAPLDFFTQEELDRYKPLGQFYVPDFIARTLPFREVAVTLKALLNWKPFIEVKATRFSRDAEKWPKVAIPVNPYELSDAVFQALLPLWSPGAEIEPFFISIFANEFCGPLPQSLLMAAREQSIERYERSLMWAGTAVFLALHMGITSVDFLVRLRKEVFELGNGFLADLTFGDEWKALAQLIDQQILSQAEQKVTYSGISLGDDPVSQKLTSRLKRVQSSLKTETRTSIFGPGGFVDV